MNCKPGDLAFIVRAPHPRLRNILGAVVKVTDNSITKYVDGPAWLCDGVPCVQAPPDHGLPGEQNGRLAYVPDAWLRPIRDNDGEDETLTWAGKPSDIKTPEAA